MLTAFIRNSVAILGVVSGVLIELPLSAQTSSPLAIQPSGVNQFQLAWPAGTNFDVLQELFGFAATNDWRDVSDAPAIIGSHYGILRDATNDAAFYRLVSRGTPGSSTPPDPSTTASELAPNTFNDHASLTAFLYTGSNAVQVGVGPGTIDPTRSSVLRGKVKRRDNSPLPGVRVAILNHAEFGYTVTRTDGMFDLAVNAGLYTVDLQAIGYCPAQRQVQAPIQDFRTLKDVVMVGMDPIANAIAFGSNAPAQMAHSSVITDGDGTRSVSILFPTGTSANLVMPDGTSQACNGLTIRATEFTVGTNGLAAMPAPLPPTSAYTYCAEFTGDEAVNVGARSIVFNQTVWGYLENFLGITVGALVPAGSYDRQKAAWVPEKNGLVIQILGVSGGLAQLDLDGSGVAADSGTLATNQFTTIELQQLAANYASGTTLWRMPMAHFTAIDWNFGFKLNNRNAPTTPGDSPQTPTCDTCPPNYGTVNYSSQVFEETIPLVGVPMALDYSSARVPGYHVLANAVVPVSGGADVTGITSAEVRSEIAGVVTDLSYGWSPTNSRIPDFTTISWDGYDAYGRFLGGTRSGSISVTFLFPFHYGGLRPITDSYDSYVDAFSLFANFGFEVVGSGHTATGLDARQASFDRRFTIPDHRRLGLGGWSLTPHHLYDPDSKYLYLGDGRVLKPEHLGNAVERLPGLEAFIGSGAGATRVAAAADGTLFFLGVNVSILGNALFKRTPEGQYAYISASNSVSGVIGVAEDWSSADGQPASKLSLLGGIGQLKTGPDGSLYVRSGYTIARIDTGGTVHIVLGMGAGHTIYPPDGTLARAAFGPSSAGEGVMAVGPDGTVYYDDAWTISGTNYSFIRKVAPDGRIYTITGQAGPLAGTSWADEMGKPADQARMNTVQDLAIGPDGSVFISPITGYPFEGGIYKITPGGTTEMVMANIPVTKVGNEGLINIGDEGSSAASPTNGVYMPGASARSLQVTPDGSVFFLADYSLTSSIWKITPNGIRERVAGRGPGATVTLINTPLEGGNPLDTELYYPNDFTVGPDGGLTLVTQTGFTWSPLMHIAHIGPSLPGFNASEISIASEDGSEVYVFDEHGRHLLTLNGLTGTTNWVFSYNAINLVTDLTDANGLITHIQRDGAGAPTAIIGPYGQQTVLGLDANGFLSTVVNPVGETTTLTHSKDGLLTSITRPLGDSDTVVYDSLGLVTQIRDPLGGGYDLTRSDTNDLVSIRSATTLANVNSRLLVLQPSGDTLIASTYPDGTTASSTRFRSGSESDAYSDGTFETYGTAGDPRFPQASRLTANASVQLPGGPASTLTISRAAALSDTSNPFSVATLSNAAVLNGQLWKASYNGTSRVWMALSPVGRQAVIGLDGQGRVIHQKTAGLTPMDVAYDNQGHVGEIDDTASIGLRRTTFTYDAFGRLAGAADAMGRTNGYQYDGAGRLQQIVLSDGQVAGFQSDAEFRLTSVTPPGRPAHRFERNSLGLVTNYVPPIVNGLDESVQYTYDADRNPTRVALPDGQNVIFTRGLGGRIDKVVLGSGPTLTYAYSPNNGLPTDIISTSGDGMHFDYQGSIATNTTWSGSITGRVGMVLNADLLPASQSVNGTSIAYAYDGDLLLTDAGGLSATRDPASGFITGTTLGTVTDQRQYDDRGLLTNYVAKISGTSVWSFVLNYDAVDRLTNKVETVSGLTRSFRYVYDLAGRLQQVWQNGALVTTYTYDANGNRLSRNAETATYDSQDRVQTYAGASFGWSRNGTLQSRTSGAQVTSYTYDARGALTAVEPPVGPQIDYVNDATGQRIGKKVGGTLQRGWLWDEDLPITELDTDSAVALRFVYAADGATPSFLVKGTNTYRLVSDERGSVRQVVNVADGSIAQQLDYDEFGRVLLDTAPGFQPFGFAGGLYDADTRLVRFGARDYSAETGQWLARDPIGFAGGQTSLYAYAGQDPVNLIDPFGAQPSGGKKCDCFSDVYNLPFDPSKYTAGGAGLSFGGRGGPFGFSASLSLVADKEGNVGLALQGAYGLGWGMKAGVGFTGQSNYGTIYSPGGTGSQGGGSLALLAALGLDFAYNDKGQPSGQALTLGMGLGWEGHYQKTHTGVIGFNPGRFFDRVSKLHLLKRICH